MDYPDTIVKQLFGEALELPPEQRAAFLDRACEGRSELRRQVEAILAENERLNGMLSDSPWNLADVFPEEPSRGQQISPGMLLGRYRMIEQMGAGGMGVVYRAQDEKLNRVVAVKIVTPGVLTSNDARDRFRREALALARLNHPTYCGRLRRRRTGWSRLHRDGVRAGTIAANGFASWSVHGGRGNAHRPASCGGAGRSARAGRGPQRPETRVT